MAAFEPTTIGLSPGFVLTEFTKLKGWGCKIPQEKLLELLRNIGTKPGDTEGEKKNVGMDCSIVEVKKLPGVFMISTLDFFYPLIDDPYVQGRVGCANVLSDLYSMGIDEVDTMLMVLAASRDMSHDDRWIVTEKIMEGFNDLANEAGTEVTGGQSVMNPWPMIGGAAMSVCKEGDFIRPDGLQVGDVMVLTKPLGTQVAVNLKEWFGKGREENKFYKMVAGTVSEEEVQKAFGIAAQSMSHLNRVGARLMRKYGAHAGTDVTGFGYYGHAENMAIAQPRPLQIRLDLMPCIAGMARVDAAAKDMFRLAEGKSAETSGGLLVGLPTEAAARGFCDELRAVDKTAGWIVGKAVARPDGDTENTAVIAGPVLEVDTFYLSPAAEGGRRSP